MPLLGSAALAMWWTIAPEHRAEFGDWHSHEHFPERLGIPGFQRASRWRSRDSAGDFFVMYELESYDVLTSPAYLERLNAPTPWSTKMMPHHRSMVRSQCRVAASFGGGIGGSIATMRISPAAGRGEDLHRAVTAALRELPVRPGLTGAHLLVTDTPKTTAPTREQVIRGHDRTADWIVVVAGYDAAAVTHAASTAIGTEHERVAMGARSGAETAVFHLDLAMTRPDL